MAPAVKRLLPPRSSKGARSSTTTLAPCSSAASAAVSAAFPPPTTSTSHSSSAIVKTPLADARRGVCIRSRAPGKPVDSGVRMMATVLERFADYAACLNEAPLPADALRHARRCVLDWPALQADLCALRV